MTPVKTIDNKLASNDMKQRTMRYQTQLKVEFYDLRQSGLQPNNDPDKIQAQQRLFSPGLSPLGVASSNANNSSFNVRLPDVIPEGRQFFKQIKSPPKSTFKSSKMVNEMSPS